MAAMAADAVADVADVADFWVVHFFRRFRRNCALPISLVNAERRSSGVWEGAAPCCGSPRVLCCLEII
jgi:hypothetical protein